MASRKRNSKKDGGDTGDTQFTCTYDSIPMNEGDKVPSRVTIRHNAPGTYNGFIAPGDMYEPFFCRGPRDRSFKPIQEHIKKVGGTQDHIALAASTFFAMPKKNRDILALVFDELEGDKARTLYIDYTLCTTLFTERDQ